MDRGGAARGRSPRLRAEGAELSPAAKGGSAAHSRSSFSLYKGTTAKFAYYTKIGRAFALPMRIYCAIIWEFILRQLLAAIAL